MVSSIVYWAAPILIKRPERKNLNLQLPNLTIAWSGTKGLKWEVADCQFEHTWFGTLGI
jgi:hypothetical protein